jgi:hypothetical protein
MNTNFFSTRWLLITISAFLFTAASAQGVYEIKYKFYEQGANSGRQRLSDQEYSSIVFFYDANNPQNVMRTRYYDDKEGWMVVEQKVRVSTKFLNGKSCFVLDGMNPKYISPSTTTAKYNPDHIVLSKTSSGSDYKPEYVYDDGNTKGIITSFKTLNTDDISTSYLSPYKWSWTQPQTQTRTETQTRTNNNSNNTNTTYTKFDLSQSTLHLILVANTNDSKLGEGFGVNEQLIQDLFKSAAQTCNMKFDKVEVKGYSFGKKNVQNAIYDLDPSPNDVVVFYYSGHGFRMRGQTSNWPLMDLRNNSVDDMKSSSMSLDKEVYNALAAKNPRLLIVVGECCNVYVDGLGTPSIPSPLTMPLGSTIMNANIVKSLFSKKGKILIATSKPTEYTWYYNDKGGFFGSNFKSAFQKNVGFSTNTNINWTDIFKEAIKYTVQRTEAHEGGTDPQHPISYFDLQ